VTRAPRVAHVTTVDLTIRTILLGQLRRLREAGFDVTTISAPGPWVPEIRAEGFVHLPWTSATRAWDPLSDVRALVELVRILRAGDFDLVHTHTPKAGVLGRFAARAAGVPRVVNTVHGFYATPEDPMSKRLPVLALEWLAARASDLEFFVSEEDLRWARRIGLASSMRSVLLGNGVDLDWFDAPRVPASRVARLRSELGIPEEALVVGTVGRLVAEKGVREFVQAARQVRRTMPGVVFLAVGAPDRDKPDALSREEAAAAGAHVVFAGWRNDVRDVLAAMDVFVLASWREGLPVSAIHAAAMARPLVLTDIRGCREVVRDGVEGLLVPPRAPDRLAAAIRRLVADPDLRARLGAGARARSVARFDERRVGAALVQTYRALLNGGRANGDASGTPKLRRAGPGDAPAMARLHREGLPDSFLPALGPRFLRRLYRALVGDPEAVTLVAENGGGVVVGFAAGALSIGAFYRRFALRHGLGALADAAPRLGRPGVVRRVWETAAYPQRFGELPDAELVAITVEPDTRARGVGQALALGVVRGLEERGARQVKVVTAGDNEAANAFYETLGFTKRARIAVHRGRWSNVWVIESGNGSSPC
jgi:glycosyltransferase involved in cell wall biosynthesis/ribosomal protein S18 acetylase RimI-like enzyme